MNLDLLRDYAAKMLQKRKLEEDLTMMQPMVLAATKEFMDSHDGRAPEVDGGFFVVVNRKNWHYSNEVDFVAKRLKDLQKEEQATGVAQAEVVESIMLKGKDNTNEPRD